MPQVSSKLDGLAYIISPLLSESLVLRKLLRSKHAIPPSRDRTRRPTADARMVADLPLAGRWRTCGQRCMQALYQHSCHGVQSSSTHCQ